MPESNLPDLLSVLVKIGDKVSDAGSPLAGVIPEYWHVRWVIFEVLEKLPAEIRPQVLLSIAQRQWAPRTLLNVVSLIMQLRSEKGQYPEFSDERLNELKAATVNSIEEAAGRDEISVKDDALPAIVFIWTTWGKEENARLYMGRIARSDEDIVDLVNRFIYQTHSSGGGDRVVRVHNKLSMKGLSMVFDLNDLRHRLQGIDLGTLDGERRDALKIALEQLTAIHEKGMTPEQFDASRFFE